MKRIHLLTLNILCCCLLLSTQQATAQLSACGNTLAFDNCLDAPIYSLCEIDGMTGNNANYTAGPEDDLTLSFCGPGTATESSLWIAFEATYDYVEFLFRINNCVNGSGIQAAIFETDCTTFANALTCIGGVPAGATTDFTLSAVNLIPNNPYYILVDGYAGGVCDFSIEVLEGLLDPTFTTDIISPPICGVGGTATLITLTNPTSNYSYQWIDPNGNEILGETQSTLNVNQQGEYSVVVRDSSSCCDVTATTTVSTVTNAPVASIINNISNVTVNCNASNQQSIVGTFTPNLSTYQYTWLSPSGINLGNGENMDTLMLDTPEEGDYTFFVADLATGCSDEVVVNLEFDLESPSFSIEGNNVLNCINTEVLLNAVYDDLNVNYTIQWFHENGVQTANTQNIIITQSGLYNAVVTNEDNGCTASQNITIFEDIEAPDVFIEGNFNICTGACSEITISSSSINLTYDWTLPDGTLLANNNQYSVCDAGLYTVIATNINNGCTTSQSFEISEQDLLANFLNPPANLNLQCGDFVPLLTPLQYDNGAVGECQNTGFIDGVQSGEIDPCVGGTITYTWNGMDAYGTLLNHVQTITVSTATPANFVNLPPDLNLQCGDILPPLQPLVYDNGLSSLCQNTGIIQGTQSGSANPCTGGQFTYEWNGTDDCGNFLLYTQTITVAPPPSPQFLFVPINITVDCNTIPPMQPLQYDNGSLGDCNISGTITGNEIDDMAACPRTLTRTWEFNDPCTGEYIEAIQKISIIDQTEPIFLDAIPPDITLCEGELPQPFDIPWQDNCDGSGIAVPEIVDNGGSMTVFWEATDACGNQTIGTQTITIGNPPEPTISGSTTFCEGESTVLDAGSGFLDYIWNTGATTQTILVNTGGTYTVFVTELNGCTGQTQIEITSNGELPDTIQIVLCEEETITLEAPNGGTIVWSTGEMSNSIEISEAGLYYYSATDINGCIVDYPFEVIVYENPSITIAGSTTFCEGSSTTLEVITNSANYSLIWSNFQGTTISTEQTVTTDIEDIYCIVIFDLETGCTNSACIEITESTSLNPVISGDTIVCGSSSILSAGAGFANYEWSTGAITQTIDVSDSGSYCLTVSDISGCTGSTCVDVTVSPEMTILTDITNPSCVGEADGSIVLDIVGGIAPYSYEWTPLTGIPPNWDNLVAGTYSFTVTDASGCSSTTSVELVAAPSIALSYPNLSCIGECTDLGIDEIDGYSVIWTNDNDLSGTIDTLCEAGTYSLTITDGNGCSIVDELIVTNINTPFAVNLTQAAESYCGCVELFLDYDVNDPNLSFSWTEPSWENINGQLLACANGTYGITITNAEGCTGSSSIEVILDDDSEDADCVWPGDTNDDNVVNNFDALNIGLAFGAMGTERPGSDVTWRAQYPLSWNQFTPTTLIDYMYVDADGGGSIGEDDFDVMQDNWLLTHNFTEDNEDQAKEIPVDNRSPMDIPFYVQSDTLYENTNESLSIILGEENNALIGAYGVAFSVIYDPEIVVPETAVVDFSTSWLGEIGTDLYALYKDFHSEGRIDVGVTRLDGQEMDGFGVFATLNITIEDVILFKGQDENRSADSLTFFSIDNVRIITAQETEILVNSTETASTIVETTGINDLILDQFIDFYPNPANQQVIVSSSTYDLREIMLYDITGKQIALFDVSGTNTFNVSNIENGLYLVKIMTTDGIAVKKLNIQK